MTWRPVSRETFLQIYAVILDWRRIEPAQKLSLFHVKHRPNRGKPAQGVAGVYFVSASLVRVNSRLND